MKYLITLLLQIVTVLATAQFASWYAYDTIHTPKYDVMLPNTNDKGQVHEVAYFFNGFLARVDYLYDGAAFYVEERFEYGRFKHTYSYTKYALEKPNVGNVVNNLIAQHNTKHFLYNVFAGVDAQTGNATVNKEVIEKAYSNETQLFNKHYIEERNKYLRNRVDSLVKGSAKKLALEWTIVDSLSNKDIQVYHTNTTLRDRPNKAYYAVVDVNNSSLIFDVAVGAGNRYTPQEYYSMYNNPVLVINTTYFNFTKNENLNIVIDSGLVKAFNVPSISYKKQRNGTDSVIKYYYPYRAAIGINKQGVIDAAWIYNDSITNKPLAFQQYPYKLKGGDMPLPNLQKIQQLATPWNMYVAFGGGPMLLQHGDWYITNVEEQLFVKGVRDFHPRTAIGYTKEGKLIILVIEGRNENATGASLLEEAEILKQLGCVEALNLDGGGSSCMLINGKPTIQVSDKTGQRPVPAVFMIHKKK